MFGLQHATVGSERTWTCCSSDTWTNELSSATQWCCQVFSSSGSCHPFIMYHPPSGLSLLQLWIMFGIYGDGCTTIVFMATQSTFTVISNDCLKLNAPRTNTIWQKPPRFFWSVFLEHLTVQAQHNDCYGPNLKLWVPTIPLLNVTVLKGVQALFVLWVSIFFIVNEGNDFLRFKDRYDWVTDWNKR